RAGDPARVRAALLARRLVRRAPAGLLRLGPAARVAAEHRARPPGHRRPRLLVAGLRARAAAGLDGDPPCLPRRGLRRLRVSLARADLRGPSVLCVLRARAATGRPLGAEGP